MTTSVILGHGHWQETVKVGDRVVQQPGCDGNRNLSPIYGLVILGHDFNLYVRTDERFGGNLYRLTSSWRKQE